MARVVCADAPVPDLAITPFAVGYTGELNAVLADLDGDGTPELVVAPGNSGGPVVADLNRDGRAELAFAAGPGGGPRVTVVDGRFLTATGRPVVLYDAFVGDPDRRDGARVQAEGYRLRTAAGPDGPLDREVELPAARAD